jgi:uncharacterized protein with NRDE domain
VCLILFALGHHPSYPLIIAANRDESYGRPAAPLAFWPHASHIAGGRDLRAGGTWLGITRQGRWAALTNYRRAKSYREDAPSRGHLVSDYLESDVSAEQYVDSLQPTAQEYNGFNLLVADRTGLYYLSNRASAPQRVEAGVHGLSNHLLDTPWPKVQMGKHALEQLTADTTPNMILELLGTLGKREVPPESELPDTGVGQAQERVLSPPFIVAESYGTRVSTVLLVDARGRVVIEERSFGPFGTPQHAASLTFDLEENGASIFRPADFAGRP